MDQEVIKHVCKICSKNFPCGRSLGGQMRSHHHDHGKTNDDHVHVHDDDDFVVVDAKTTMKKDESCSEGYYGLRENPKKTWRVLTDSTNDQEEEEAVVAVLDKLCKECGKGFQSCKALFGHMKCHSYSNKNNLEFDDEKDSNGGNKKKNKKIVLVNDSENVLPNRRRRSKRKLRTRYINSNTCSSSTSVSDVSFGEKCFVSEEEEVALSLMMLSRDVRSWSGLNSNAESSDNNDDVDDNDDENCLELEAPLTHLVSKIEGRKRVIENGSEIVKVNKKSNDGSKKKKMKIEVDSESAFEVNVRSKSCTKYTSMKEKFFDCETKVKSEGELRKKKSRKRGKFECSTCNRIFQSYQALGGHRASHKRTKGCFATKNDQSSENELELEEVDMKINVSDNVGLKNEVPEIRDFVVDLNLPVECVDGERKDHSKIYKPWWLVGSNNLKQDTMIGLLSN